MMFPFYQKQNEMISDFNALLVLVLGLIIRYLIAERQFKRRNVAGLQQFSSFSQGLFTTAIEWIMKVMALLMIILGIVNLLV